MQRIAQVDGHAGFRVTLGDFPDVFVVLPNPQSDGEGADPRQRFLQPGKGGLQPGRQLRPSELRFGDDERDQVTLLEIARLGEGSLHLPDGALEDDLGGLLQHSVGAGIQPVNEVALDVVDVHHRRQSALGEIPPVQARAVVNLHIRLHVVQQQVLQKGLLVFFCHLLTGDAQLNAHDEHDAGIFQRRLHIAARG